MNVDNVYPAYACFFCCVTDVETFAMMTPPGVVRSNVHTVAPLAGIRAGSMPSGQSGHGGPERGGMVGLVEAEEGEERSVAAQTPLFATSAAATT